jgi:hypothetical protein
LANLVVIAALRALPRRADDSFGSFFLCRDSNVIIDPSPCRLTVKQATQVSVTAIV